MLTLKPKFHQIYIRTSVFKILEGDIWHFFIFRQICLSTHHLQVLDLSYNTLTSIEGIDFLPIEELNVEGNNLTTLDGLQNSPNLSVLNVSKNHIQHLQPAGKNTSLTVLDVQDNHISFIREVEHLAGLSWIRILKLSGNPCCSKPSYRSGAHR